MNTRDLETRFRHGPQLVDFLLQRLRKAISHRAERVNAHFKLGAVLALRKECERRQLPVEKVISEVARPSA